MITPRETRSRAHRILLPIPILLLLAAGGWLGCVDDAPNNPTSDPDPVAFYEPISFCLTDAENADTLWVFNFGDAPLTWTPEKVPTGSVGLDGTVIVEPRTVTPIPWSWNPGEMYPAQDTLRAGTDDPNRPMAEVVFRREDPTVADPEPVNPRAPILAFPGDGAEFVLSDLPDSTIELGWSVEDNCSGTTSYQIQISTTPGFTNIVCCSQRLSSGYAALEVEPGDRGSDAYWRVRTRVQYTDGIRARSGPWSEARSWRVD